MSAVENPGAEGLVQALRENAPHASGAESHLQAALAQTVAAPGKLLRAQLAFAAARSHGLPAHASEHLACGIEYFHTASLLFDDLPCMDDGATRRGQPCVHRVHGEATAILAALALINRAHVLIGFACASLPAGQRAAALCWVDDCLGVAGLIGGQERDLRFAAGPGKVREVAGIAARKTGALFRLALVLPALAGAPRPVELRRLKALALYAGLLFQAEDDLKDVLATPVEMGKSTRRDQALHRPNLALALGVPETRRRLGRLAVQVARTIGQLRAGDARWEYLADFQAGLVERFGQRAA